MRGGIARRVSRIVINHAGLGNSNLDENEGLVDFGQEKTG